MTVELIHEWLRYPIWILIYEEASQVENMIAMEQEDEVGTREQDKMRLMTRDRIRRDELGQDQGSST